jgi:hypothetical protein
VITTTGMRQSYVESDRVESDRVKLDRVESSHGLHACIGTILKEVAPNEAGRVTHLFKSRP